MGWRGILGGSLLAGLLASVVVAARPDLAGVCAPGSSMGDGQLAPFELHYVVLVDASRRDDPRAAARVPRRGSRHVDPATGKQISGDQWFDAETRHLQRQLVDRRGKPICIGKDCLRVVHRSHTFFEDIDPHACPELTAIASRGPESPALGGVAALGRAVAACQDPALRQPGAINVYLFEGGRQSDSSAVLARHEPTRPFIFLDVDRTMIADRRKALAAEEHGLGRALALRPICEPEATIRTRNNPMQADCGADEHRSRSGHFDRAARDSRRRSDVNQVRDMLEMARRIQKRWRGC